jgi:hypothetical protein
MSFQEKICKAFCADVRINPFKGGFGVSTPFQSGDGDVIGYYVLGPDADQNYRIVDNALTVALFESDGATLDSETRLSAFNEILGAYDAIYDEDDGEISIDNVKFGNLERRSLDFMALLLRLQDMYLLTQERTKNTFLEDVENKLNSLDVDGLKIQKDQPVSSILVDVIPDYLLTREGQETPVALFVVNQGEKLWQAMHLKLVAEHEYGTPLSVVALLQSDKIGSSKLRSKADNRLDAVPKWEDDEVAAIGRILREVNVPSTAVLH